VENLVSYYNEDINLRLKIGENLGMYIAGIIEVLIPAKH
jgi:hypothetical protein